MTQVTIIGATGSLGRVVTTTLLEETDVHLTLFSRSADQLAYHPRVENIAGSTADKEVLEKAVKGADLVFVALSGDLPTMAQQIIKAMTKVSSRRLVFISSYGIYGEIDGASQNGTGVLAPYRKAADMIEASTLDYTIVRPGWFNNSNDISYTLYPKGETIYGNDISRKAIADLVKRLVQDPSFGVKENWGIVR